tara:strand:- start:67 stop:801 length:735 start_codon:yes stop_codon:yes gene_type:complete
MNKIDFLPKNCKGSHVGVVLSFIIFVSFLVLLYPALIDPALDTGENKQALLEHLRTEITENISAELTTASVELTLSEGNNCIKLKNFLSSTGITSRNIVKNDKEKNQASYVSGNFLKINRDSINDDFFKVESSQEFASVGDRAGCVEIAEEDYVVGLIRTKEYVFETKIISLVENYRTGYGSLKNELGLPSSTEFDFIFEQNNKTQIGVKEEISTEIYAEEIPVQYVNKEGGILLGKIIIRIWN